jgi:hypothetical protein
VTALKKAISHLADNLKKEAVYLLIILAAMIVLLKAGFYKEGMLDLIRISMVLFLQFVAPGYLLTLRFSNKLDFLERTVPGTLFSMLATGLVSYYFGIMGLNVRFHTILIPVLLGLLGILLLRFKKPEA